MLRLLLDEHLHTAVAEHMRRLRPACEIVSMQDWESGTFLSAPDEDILRRAAEQSLTLITYDQRTINPLLRKWADAGISHGGVIFVAKGRVFSGDVGGLLRAICRVWDNDRWLDWTNRAVYI